jgi:NTE family protein
MDGPARVAIACQGGGSRTAFTAGVLGRLLERCSADHGMAEQRAQVLALSGTSGGAMCALLAWYALLTQDSGGESPAALLRDFWSGVSATEPWDVALNAALVGATRLQDYVSLPLISPYRYEAWRALTLPPAREWLDGRGRLRQLLERHVDFAKLQGLVHSHECAPRLLIAAVDVESGEFHVFKSDAEPWEITPDALLASSALPTLFEAVEVGGKFYWDGLFSQNPPIHDLLSTSLTRDEKPDEIWIIQVNPEGVASVPRTTAEIVNRRDELGGNLSLNQEVHFILRVNELIRRQREQHQVELHPDFKQVRIARITPSADLSARLDAASKLDRDPRLIRLLEEDGTLQAEAFLRHRAAGTINWEIYPR